jgi:hypothetical protein
MPGGHPGRTPYIAVVREYSIWFHPRRGIATASRSRSFQCVTACRRSSSPAAASRKLPVRTDAVRRATSVRARSRSTRFGSSGSPHHTLAAGDDQRAHWLGRVR